MSEEHFYPKLSIDFEACSPVALEKFQFVELSTEETPVTTEACPSEMVHLACELSLTDGERLEDETDKIIDSPDIEVSQKQAEADHDSSSDTECSELCPLKDYHPIDEPPGETHEDPKHWLPDQAVQASKLYKHISDWQSRIIALQPGEHGDPIRVDLHVADLIDASGIALHDKPLRVQYEALSYCWGTEGATCLIQMNGIDYPVVETLYRALQRLRTEEVRYLWIDALCIDQHNLEERSMQVANMLLLFRKATKVLVWLGEHGGHTRAAWQCFGTLWHSDIGVPLNNACPEHQSILYAGFEEILSRPWYRRLWILQELWAASQVDVILGEDTIRWGTLETFATQFERILWHKVPSGRTNPLSSYRNDNPFVAGRRAAVRDEVPVKSRDQSPRRWLLNIRDSYADRNGYQEEELIDVLRGTYSCECKDPRDRVYAVLGMTNAPYAAASKVASPDKATIIIDYGKSISEVYQDVVRYYAGIENSLDILCMDASFGGQVGGEELPSWCPNWSLPFGKDRPHPTGPMIYSNKSQSHWLGKEKSKTRSCFDDKSGYDERGDWSDLNWLKGVSDIRDGLYCSDRHNEQIAAHSWRMLTLTGHIFAVVTGGALWQDFTTYQNSIITVILTRQPFYGRRRAEDITRVDTLPKPQLFSNRDHQKQPRYNKGLDGVHWYMSGKAPRIDDVVVSAEKTSLTLILRPQPEQSQYKFVGVVENPGYELLSEMEMEMEMEMESASDSPSCLHIV